MKKYILLFSVTFLIMIGGFGQAPQGINYQAVVRDNLGNVISNAPVGMKVSIHQGFPTGTLWYIPNHLPQPPQI
jgi:hypothetical protein